jgi:hypothetical protein
MIKSVTAVKHGFGSMPHRSVSGLTKSEREAVKNGETVYFAINKTHYMQSGYKIVTHSSYGWDSREPSEAELKQITGKGQHNEN